jgi:Putative zinc- or iron-chelating domain
MAHGSSPLLFSRLSRLEFPGSEAIRQLWRVAPPFVTAVFSREGMLTREGRILIRGKFRRLLICAVPPLARHLRAHYGLQGGCCSCGASCNLLFRCPHWNTDSRLCTVYESRPRVCRMFPITPTDLRDRDLVLRHTVCGFHFAAEKKDTRPVSADTADFTTISAVGPTGQVLWSDTRRWGNLFTGFRSATRGVIKELRQRRDEQEKQ